MFAKCEIFALCVKVRFTAREKNVFHFRERSFFGARKNVFHFRERSFFGARKKCLPFPRMFVFTMQEKNVFHFRERENEKKAESLGEIIFSSVAVVKKLHSAGNNVKCTVKLLLLKYEGGNGDGIS